MSSDIAITLTGILVASACALPGCFLILRKMAMMSDAISHAILPGLVLGYVLAQGPNMPMAFLGSALAAVVMISLIGLLQRHRHIDSQSAIGIVFPAMFALGIFVISRYFSNVHLDTDAVLYGNIEFASIDVLIIGDTVLGPLSIWVMSALLVLNLLFICLFYKELKITTFDTGLAITLGFSPVVLHYALMMLVSLTTVGAFSAVGAILAVALMIVPAATAYLLTERLPWMLALSVLIGALSAVSGYFVAFALDASVAGAMASMTGVFFGLTVLFSPSRGILTALYRRQRQRRLNAIS